MAPTRLGPDEAVETERRWLSASRVFHDLDWSTTPLGPQESWPQVLRTLVDLALHSRQPMFVVWGPEETTIYNDGYAEILARKHPFAMGKAFAEIWPEIYDRDLQPIVEKAYAGTAVQMDDIELVMMRNGYPEEAHFSFSYTPVRDGAGEVMGFFCPCQEITQSVFDARRGRAMDRLNETLRTTQSPRAILPRASARIAAELSAQAVAIGRLDPARGDLRVEEQWIAEGSPAIPPRIAMETHWPGVTGKLHADGAFLLHGPEDDEGPAVPKPSAIRKARSVLALRIEMSDGDNACVLVLDHRSRHWFPYEVELVRALSERVWPTYQRAVAAEELRASEARSRLMMDALPQIAWSTGPDGRTDYLNARWFGYTGTYPATFELSHWIDYVHPEDRDGLLGQRFMVLARPEPYETEVRIWRDGEGYRTMLVRGVPVPDESCGTIRWLGTATDIHEIREVERSRRLLADELNHRVKNTLAIVRSVASQSFRGQKDVPEMLSDFQNRLGALAQTQDLLMRENWQAALLADIIETSLKACGLDPTRYSLSGPDLLLPPRTAVSFSMAIHELCTNAIKYGALLSQDGEIRIAWETSLAADGRSTRLSLTWSEHGGPSVTEPDRRGFGSRMIERALATELDGRADLHFDPAGLTCRVEAEIAPATDAALSG